MKPMNPLMPKSKKINTLKTSKHIIFIGMSLGVLFWIIESLLHTLIFREGTFAGRLLPPDAREIWIRLFVLAIIIIFSIYAQGIINKLKNTEKETRGALKELNQVFNTAADGMRVIDRNFTVFRVNDTFSTLSGFSRKEAVGKKCYDVFGGSLCKTVGCPLNQVLKGEERVEFDVEKIRKDGTRIFCTLMAVPLRGNGKEPIGIVENFRDISEYEIAREAFQEIEERYRDLQKNIPLGIFRSTPGGRIIAGNPAMVKMFGYESEEEMLGAPAGDFYLHLEQRDGLLKGLKKKGVVSGFEVQLKRKDGFVFWASLNIKGVTGKSGEIMYHDGIMEDISRNKKMEEEMIKSEKLESLGLLAGGIAHDFNNFLASILVNIGFLKLVLKKENRAATRLNETEKAVMRAKTLTQQLLTFSNGGAPVKGTASIAELLTDTANFALSGSRVKCKYTFAENLRDVEIDEGQISQVIRSLVINAAQAMPGGGMIHILADNLTVCSPNNLPLEEGKYIKIIVNDQGTGIPAEHLDKIFDPFFTTKEKKSGLGLSIAYSIIKKHNGLITVESQPGMGTSFYIYLPASGKKKKTRKEKEQHTYANRGRVLLMDDEALILECTGDLLKEIGYTVELAKNGAEVLKLYEDARQSGNPFDVVVLDLIVPGGMGGQETIRELRRMDPQVKAVVSSGYSTDPVIAKHKEYGFVSALSKPYRMKDLSSVLREVVSTCGKCLN
ncbi:MAG: PAS domain S-box protein [Candidatus Aminicenantes bacterium]|nr:PAS domain S-box protein [Candidatus Aminicenantes bacterium]